MELKTYFALDGNARVIPNVSFYVYLAGTNTLAPYLEDENGVELPNPFSSGTTGKVFFAAPNGDYDIRSVKNGVESVERVQFNDVSDSVDAVEDAADRAAQSAADAAEFSQLTEADREVTGLDRIATGLDREAAELAKDEAIAAASASGDVVFVQTYADAEGKLPLPDGTAVEVSQDESHDGDRTRYIVATGALVFAVNLNQIKKDLANATDPEKGAGMVTGSLYTVESLQAAVGMVWKSGMRFEALGYWYAGDGGSNLYEVVSAGTGGADGGSYIDLDNGLQAMGLFPNGVSVKQFGAKGDGETDDTTAIQAAIDFLAGGRVYFPQGVYCISDTLQISRGICLKGAGPFETVADAASTIYLMDGSNCAMLQTPAARYDSDDYSTHYMGLEDLRFNGNKTGQSIEVEDGAVQFWGAWIGSWVRNVAVSSTLGPGFTLGYGTDVQIDHLWVNAPQTASGYGFDSGCRVPTSNRFGLLNIDHLYVENVSNKTGGDPRYIPGDRGKGIRFRRLVTLNTGDVHVEAVTHGVDLESNHVVNIGSLHGMHIGYDSEPDSALLRHLDTETHVVEVGPMYIGNRELSAYFVRLKDGLSSNYLPEMPLIAGRPYAPSYKAVRVSNTARMKQGATDFTNLLNVQRVGDATNPQVKITFQDEDGFYYIANNPGGRLGATLNQPDSAPKDFITLESHGHSSDRALMGVPLVLHERDAANNIAAGSIYKADSLPGVGNTGPVYQRGAGVYQEADGIMTARRGNGAPTMAADYVGQVYIDYDSTPRSAYIAVNYGHTGGGDWEKITA